MRTERGLPQAALARQAGLSAGYVGLIETGDRGERPALDVVKRLAAGLRCDSDELEELLQLTGHLAKGERLIKGTPRTLREFVTNDPRLTNTQKDCLLALCASWGLD